MPFQTTHEPLTLTNSADVCTYNRAMAPMRAMTDAAMESNILGTIGPLDPEKGWPSDPEPDPVVELEPGPVVELKLESGLGMEPDPDPALLPPLPEPEGIPGLVPLVWRPPSPPPPGEEGTLLGTPGATDVVLTTLPLVL
jgi:hypothetical protein